MALRYFFKNLSMLYPILIGPLFYQGFYTKDGLDFPLAHGHRSVRPTRLGLSGLVFCFHPLHLSTCINFFFFAYLFLLCLDIFRFSLKHKLFFKGFESEKFINNKLMFITLFKFNYFCLRFKKIMILRGEFFFWHFFLSFL